MREIKFRAWNKVRKCWIWKPRWQACYNDVNTELMQYTGLKDKNGKGKEVYFDDIAKDEHGQVFLIEWNYPLLARLQEIWFEVIGNIYENSELLAKEK